MLRYSNNGIDVDFSVHMNKTFRVVLLWLFSYILAFNVLALNICGKCGYENEETSPLCTHCSAKLAVKKTVESQPTASSNFSDYIDSAIVSDEVKAGHDQYERGKYELARLFYANAAALEALADPADENNRSEKILGLIKKSEHAARVITKKCHHCDGTGKGVVKFESLSSAGGSAQSGGRGKSTKIPQAPGKVCERCKGLGTVKVTGTINEMKYKIGQALSEYREIQQSRKFIPMGNAWIPPALEGELKIQQKAALMRAVPSKCDYCAGFGKIDCSKCKGEGRLPCTNSYCQKGKVPIADDDRKIVKMNMKQYKVCPECNGRGSIECSACKGDGAILCSRCGGTGESEMCSKCFGKGYSECRRCKGLGEYKGASCAECGGGGFGLCTSCKGEGRKQ